MKISTEIRILKIRYVMKEAGIKRASLKMVDVMEKVGNDVKLLRESKGLNQTELGYLMQSDKCIVSNIESARHRVNIFTLVRIADALDVDLVVEFREKV